MMEWLTEVKNYSKYAIGFIILVMIFSMIGGEKGAFYFLLLVLAGAVILNHEKINSFLNSMFGGGT